MSADSTKLITALCPWCSAEVFAVGICLVNEEALPSCHAWRCDACDVYLDCLGLPIQFDKIVFTIPGIQNCRF